MPKISIIIRTKNEEDWISHCLENVFNQDYKDFEVILVDNNSSDNTLKDAKRYPLSKVINVDSFFPGDALNRGIRLSVGDFIVCLSAHCVPKNTSWLGNLLANFNDNPKVAGVYGRQLPVSYTDPIDKRDLLITFGRDKRIQKKDYFFHNANSMLRRDIWEKFPFDSKATNIEDRIWGKTVTENNLHIIYEPSAEVYHHHGLHQGNTKKRVQGVVSIIEKLDIDIVNDLPDSLKPGNIQITAIIPIKDNKRLSPENEILLNETFNNIKKSKFINNAYLVSNHGYKTIEKESWINRKNIRNSDNLSIENIMSKTLEIIEAKGSYPSLLMYVNYEYLYKLDKIDQLISERQYKGYDTVFHGYEDYGHYWVESEGNYNQITTSLDPRSERSPSFSALYGQGCLTSVSNIRKGKLVGGKVGILKVKEFKYTLRLNSNSIRELIEDGIIKSLYNSES
jgi:rhamnosyltransferase